MGLYQYAAFALGTPYAPQTSTYSPQPAQKPLQKSHRHHAVRHREPPVAAPGSRREFMLQQQQLVQEEYFTTQDVPGHVFSSGDADLAREDYVSHAVAEVPGYFYNDGSASVYRSAGAGTGTRGLTLQRTHAVRSGTAPTPREGSRRAAMINGEREQQYNAHAGISGFSRRKAQGQADNDYYQMQAPMAPSHPQPQPHFQHQHQPQSYTTPQPSYSTPHYMVRPRPAGYSHTSRFQEQF